jgi:hypothetical protein
MPGEVPPAAEHEGYSDHESQNASGKSQKQRVTVLPFRHSRQSIGAPLNGRLDFELVARFSA